MSGQRLPQNPLYWFIPGLLICVFVLSGLCLFFIQRQVHSEENQLRDQERFSLEQTQQLFRQSIQAKWQNALNEFAYRTANYAEIRSWDLALGEDTLGFSLDDSGMLFYPSYQIYPQPDQSNGETRRILANVFGGIAKEFNQSDRPNLNGSDAEESFRKMQVSAEKKQRERVLSFGYSLLTLWAGVQLNGGLPAALPGAAAILEYEEISEKTLSHQAAIVDAWLSIYEESLLPLTPVSFPWLNRLQEQCRRRNDREAWLAREKRVARLVRQIQWAEKCLPRLNLLLRRNLYNSARSQLPVQVLNEEPYVILCQFLAGSPLTLIGMAVDLDQFCKSLETKIARIDWLPVEVLIQIQRQAPGIPLNPGVSAKDAPAPEFAVETRDSSKKEPVRPVTTHSLQETRILDPWAPQFIAQARLRDYRAFERRSLQKNLLYFSIVMLTITSCVLVLFFGNRALKEQQRLSKLRTDFLTNVSHELKTPLTAIRLHAETLERQSSGNIAPASSSLETIVEEVDRLSALINDVLEFTRLENDKKRYVWESVDLVPVIQESIQLFSQQLGESHFKVVLDLPESLVLSKADRAALKQCAVNLLSNSLKFSPDEKYLAIRLAHEDKQAVWEVEDHGIGVDPRDRPHIFEKFYRGSSLDPALSGTGLGLTLCKAFIEAHGGQITYDGNHSGKGSRFVIRLPIQDNRREPG